MINIIYTINDTPLSERDWNTYLSEIPDLFKKRILKLVRLEDRQNSLTGKLLLKYGLENFTFPPLNIKSVELSPLGKPFIYHGLSFNISHSGILSVCAFNRTDIGIDVELIKPIDFNDFFNVFTTEEKHIITNSNDPTYSFYDIWTRKESVLKAQGSGLTNNLNEFCVSRNRAMLNGTIWNIYPILINHNYICNIAVKELNPAISLKQIYFT